MHGGRLLRCVTCCRAPRPHRWPARGTRQPAVHTPVWLAVTPAVTPTTVTTCCSAQVDEAALRDMMGLLRQLLSSGKPEEASEAQQILEKANGAGIYIDLQVCNGM